MWAEHKIDCFYVLKNSMNTLCPACNLNIYISEAFTRELNVHSWVSRDQENETRDTVPKVPSNYWQVEAANGASRTPWSMFPASRGRWAADHSNLTTGKHWGTHIRSPWASGWRSGNSLELRNHASAQNHTRTAGVERVDQAAVVDHNKVKTPEYQLNDFLGQVAPEIVPFWRNYLHSPASSLNKMLPSFCFISFF